MAMVRMPRSEVDKVAKTLKLNTANRQALSSALDNMLSVLVRKQMREGNEKFKYMFEKAVTDWFEEGIPGYESTNYQNTIRAIRYISPTFKQTGNKINITFCAEFDLNAYQRGMNQYGTIFKSKYNGMGHRGEYVLNLQWRQGILGLPKYSSQTDWINPSFHKGVSMYKFVKDRFSTGTWERENYRIFSRSIRSFFSS